MRGRIITRKTWPLGRNFPSLYRAAARERRGKARGEARPFPVLSLPVARAVKLARFEQFLLLCVGEGGEEYPQ